MNKLNFFGIGPQVGRIALPVLAATIVFSILFNNLFEYEEGGSRILFFVGVCMLVLGLTMYFFTLPALLKGLKETRLVTTKAFYFCCNPLYASIILFIIPGISLMMNSWLVLTASVAAYLLFKMNIKREYVEMEKFFGEEYKQYRAQTPEFFPLPIKKWLK